MNKLSVYGATGFIGGTFCDLYPDEVIKIPREERKPQSKDIFYLISTTTNHHVFDDLHKDVDTNLTVLMDVLEHCKEEDLTFNFVSTAFVYGNDIINAKEDDPCDPGGFYSITKRCAEKLLISYCQTFDIKYRIMRIANVYGDDKTVSAKKNVLKFLIGLMAEDKDLLLYDDGMQLRDYMHVSDICRAMKLVMEKGEINSIYNIAAGNPLPFKIIMEKAREYLGSNSKFNYAETPKFNKIAQAYNYSVNVDKLKGLGFQPEINFEEGLKSLCS
tara:strand:- start:224 stop:1042 length:819 start_codon:yes stop_codon:yes gene_type:complete